MAGDFNGNDDLVTPKGPLGDAAAQAPAKVEIPGIGSHCGDRIDLILPSAPMRALFYDGVYGGVTCMLAGVLDHPLVSAVLACTTQGQALEQWGTAGDVPMPADFDATPGPTS